ncbi:MAG: hypothetical protein AAFX78_09350 [Cyanobacteria bacterium J06638_20]
MTAYAQILAGMNGNSSIDFSEPKVQADLISYGDYPHPGEPSASLCKADLILTGEGTVSAIKIT